MTSSSARSQSVPDPASRGPNDLDRLVELHREFCEVDDHPFDDRRARPALRHCSTTTPTASCGSWTIPARTPC
jgi:hypothetical protein